MGESVIQFVRLSFRQGEFDKSLDNSPISLIPKSEHPKSISQLRQIALCNIVVKVVTEVVANRLKKLMPKLTSSNSIALFLGGRDLIALF